MSQPILRVLSVGAALIIFAAPAHATDVVFIGGTGTGTVLAVTGDPVGITRPFVPDAHTVTPQYDGAPWANPQDAVPLVADVVAAHPQVTVIGLSKGAQVARAVEVVDPNPTTKYVLIADPDDDHGVSRTFSVSPPKREFTHDVDIVVAEYDGVGDFPDRPNPLAVANAVAGWVYIHPQYGSGTPDDPLLRLQDSVTTVTRNANGTTTTTRRRIPTQNLPMLKPLRDTELTITGQSRITDTLNAVLKPVVDSGYSRTTVEPTRSEPSCLTCSPSSTGKTSENEPSVQPPKDSSSVADSLAEPQPQDTSTSQASLGPQL